MPVENITIGITGGIGSGKSIVSRILRCNGIFVYDCDSEAKYLMKNTPYLKRDLISFLGKEIYLNNGELNRKYLAQRLFSDSNLRTKVNIIVHEAVRKDILSKREKIKGWFFIESAILATAKLDSYCDKIWVVTASLQERIKRISKRDCLSDDEILKRIESQNQEISFLPWDKIVMIENNSDNQLLLKVLNLINIPVCSSC